MYCGEGNGNPLQYSCLENSIEEPGGYSSWGPKEWDTTEQTLARSLTYMYRWVYAQCIQSFWKRQANKSSFQLSFDNFPSIFFFFFVVAVLWENLHTIQFTHLKCMVQLLLSCLVMSSSSQPHGLQLARLLCSSLSHGSCSDSCHPTISSSVQFSGC